MAWLQESAEAKLTARPECASCYRGGYISDWLFSFPHMDHASLRDLKKAIDEGFGGFTRAYGDGL